LSSNWNFPNCRRHENLSHPQAGPAQFHSPVSVLVAA
jgi:hypothetical protein